MTNNSQLMMQIIALTNFEQRLERLSDEELDREIQITRTTLRLNKDPDDAAVLCALLAVKLNRNIKRRCNAANAKLIAKQDLTHHELLSARCVYQRRSR